MNRGQGNDGLSAREQALSEYFDGLLGEPVPEDEVCTPSELTVDRQQVPQAVPVVDRLTDESTDQESDEKPESAAPRGSDNTANVAATGPVDAATHTETTPLDDADSSMMAPSTAGADSLLATTVDSVTTAASASLYLKFQTAGLSLAIPKEKVREEITWTADIAPVAGSPAWILGQRRFEDHTVQIVDTAMLIIPKGRRDTLHAASRAKYQHIIVIGDGRWGLACDKQDGQIDLSAKEVNWRTELGTRPWLAGTLTQDRCALLDADAMVKLLDSGQWSD